MNIRLNKSSIRFRITRDELCLLESKKTLQEDIFLPNRKLTFKIIVKDCQEMEIIDEKDEGLILLVSEPVLKFLTDSVPLKEGFCKEFIFNKNKLLISLEIDVSRRKKTS